MSTYSWITAELQKYVMLMCTGAACQPCCVMLMYDAFSTFDVWRAVLPGLLLEAVVALSTGVATPPTTIILSLPPLVRHSAEVTACSIAVLGHRSA